MTLWVLVVPHWVFFSGSDELPLFFVFNKLSPEIVALFDLSL